ncbi:hypothetical protein Pelo_8609 [Pelomyxa schiedti]|nr:hypothetical protein Pelo_8609 [Pelomyxa schiedti]
MTDDDSRSGSPFPLVLRPVPPRDTCVCPLRSLSSHAHFVDSKEWRSSCLCFVYGWWKAIENGPNGTFGLLPQSIVRDIASLCMPCDILTDRAMLAIYRGRYEEGLRLFKQALLEDPYYIPALVGLRGFRLWRPLLGQPTVPSAVSLIRRAKEASQCQYHHALAVSYFFSTLEEERNDRHIGISIDNSLMNKSSTNSCLNIVGTNGYSEIVNKTVEQIVSSLCQNLETHVSENNSSETDVTDHPQNGASTSNLCSESNIEEKPLNEGLTTHCETLTPGILLWKARNFLLGSWHYFVRGEPELAPKLWSTAIDICPMSMNCLGNCYCDGDSCEKDTSKGVILFVRAAQMIHAAAVNNLGFSYLTGSGLPKDKDKAISFFDLSAKLGSVQGTYNLAWSYYKGSGPLAPDPVKAVELFRCIANQDHIGAQINLVDILRTGRPGVPVNLEESLFWLKAAAPYDNRAKATLQTMEQLLLPPPPPPETPTDAASPPTAGPSATDAQQHP